MISSTRNSRLRLVLLCALALLAACKPSPESLAADHRAAVEAVFAKIRAVDAAVRDTPPITEDRIDLGGATIVLDGEHDNALFLLARDVAKPEDASTYGTGADLALRSEWCAKAMRAELLFDPEIVERHLQDCEHTEYLFVLRTTVDEAPELVDQETFKPGRYAGDVLLFRLADGALLGGYRVAAKNDDQVRAEMGGNAGAEVDALYAVGVDLKAHVHADIVTKLQAHVPGAIP